MHLHKTSVLCAGLVAGLCFVSSTKAQDVASTSGPDGVRSIDLLNTSFPIRDGTRPISFREGEFKDHDFTYSVLRRTYGDLTGDGKDDAAVLVRKIPTGTKVPVDVICILTFDNGTPKLHSSFVPASAGGYVLSIASLRSNFSIKNQALTIDVAIRERNMAPERYYTATFRIVSSIPTLTDRSMLKKLPENMREQG